MIQSKNALFALRLMSTLTMSVGAAAMVDGFLNARTIPLFIFDVPSWVIGASAIYMGLRYWRRIPAMEKKVNGSTFQWSNFWIFKAR
jgi:hypothetical protein